MSVTHRAMPQGALTTHSPWARPSTARLRQRQGRCPHQQAAAGGQGRRGRAHGQAARAARARARLAPLTPQQLKHRLCLPPSPAAPPPHQPLRALGVDVLHNLLRVCCARGVAGRLLRLMHVLRLLLHHQPQRQAAAHPRVLHLRLAADHPPPRRFADDGKRLGAVPVALRACRKRGCTGVGGCGWFGVMQWPPSVCGTRQRTLLSK